MEVVSPPSASSATSCEICNQHTAIYTCPKCKKKTCTAQCSTRHKTLFSCNGQRDRAAYIPINQYGWGSMMDDYVLLEDVGRFVESHGRAIARGSFLRSEHHRGHRGKGRGRPTPLARGSKRDTLQMQLSFKDIYVDFLPEGMERRTQNSSRFDFRTRSIYLTLELKVHPPRASNASSFKLLIQNNNLGSQFHTLLSNHFYSSSPPDKSLDSWPSWILELIDSLPVTPTPAFLSQYPPQPREISANVFGRNLGPSAHFSNGYYQIDTSQTLAQILRDREFLEFPTFELFATYPSLNEILIIAESPDIDVIKRPAAKRPRIEQHPEFVDHMLGGYGSTDNEGDPAQDRDQTDDEDVGVDILGYGTDNDNLGETRFSEEYDVGEIGEAESEIPGVLGDGTESDSSSVWSSGVEDDVTDLITDQ